MSLPARSKRSGRSRSWSRGESLALRDDVRGDDYDQRWRDLADSGEGIHGEADLISALSAGGSVLDRAAAPVGSRSSSLVAATRSSASTSIRECSTPPSEGPRTRVASRRPARHRPRPHLRPCRAPGNVMIFLSPGTEADVVANMARHLATDGRLVTGFQLGEAVPARRPRRRCRCGRTRTRTSMVDMESCAVRR